MPWASVSLANDYLEYVKKQLTKKLHDMLVYLTVLQQKRTISHCTRKRTASRIESVHFKKIPYGLFVSLILTIRCAHLKKTCGEITIKDNKVRVIKRGAQADTTPEGICREVQCSKEQHVRR